MNHTKLSSIISLWTAITIGSTCTLAAAPTKTGDEFHCRFILVNEAFLPSIQTNQGGDEKMENGMPVLPQTTPAAGIDRKKAGPENLPSISIPSNIVLVDAGNGKSPASIALQKGVPTSPVALPKGKPISLYRESIAKQGGAIEKRNAGKTAPEVSSANWNRVICLLQSQDNGTTFALTPFDLGPAKESKAPTVTVANLGSRDYFVRATPTATWECCKPGTPVTLTLPEGTKDCDIPIGTPRTRRGKTSMSMTSSAYINFVEKEPRTVILLIETVPGSPDVITVPGDFTPAKP